MPRAGVAVVRMSPGRVNFADAEIQLIIESNKALLVVCKRQLLNMFSTNWESAGVDVNRSSNINIHQDGC